MAKKHHDPIAALCDALGDAWRPRPRVSLADWCAANIELPKEVSATPGKFDLNAYPFWRGVLDQAEDPETEKIVIIKSTQVGGTTAAIALMLALSVLQPAPGMFAAPDRDAMRELREKIYLIAEKSGLADQLPPARLRNDRWIDIAGARWYSGIAYNTQTLSGKSCRVVLKTELDRWRRRKNFGDPKLIADERVKAFFRSLILEEGTPSDEESSIAASYAASDQRRFYVPCPTCGHYQELRFFPLRKGPFAGRGGVAGIKTDEGKYLSADAAISAAHYVCERGCRIESDEKDAMVRAGVWLPKGVTINARGKRKGEPLRGPRVAGFRLNALYAQTVSFGRMAAAFVERRGKQATLQTFVNDWLGQRFAKRGKTPKWRSIWAKLKTPDPPDIVPSWGIFLTAAADPGPHYARWSVRCWGEGGVSSLVSWGTTRGSPANIYAHLAGLRAELLERQFPLAAPNAAGDKFLSVRLCGIDVGFQPHLVHRWVRSLPPPLQRRVRQLAGKQELPAGQQWNRRTVEVSARTGKVYEGGQERWEISKAIFTEDLHARWQQSTSEPGAWLLCNAKLGTLELYLRELTNERAARKMTAAGRTATVWEKIDGNVGNHFADVESMNLALAEMVTGGNWTGLAARKRGGRTPTKRGREHAPATTPQPYGRMRT